MKVPQQVCKPSDTDRKVELGCNKMQCLKPGKRTHKLSGNIRANYSRGVGQSFAGNQMALKGGSFMGAPFSNSRNLSAQRPQHSEKIKLQFFPIDDATQMILQQEEHNPYLELTLAPRKKMSSIVQHLNKKWGSSQCAKGELMLFPYNARLDSIPGCEKWTLNDSCTAADVFVAVGSPSTFRLRYGWYEPNYKQQSNGAFSATVYSVEKPISDEHPDPVFVDQKQMLDACQFPSKLAIPSVECNTGQAVDNQSKATPLSWLDYISNISFGTLLSEAVPSQDSRQPPLQNNLIPPQIPVTCDSFDAAIASLITQQTSSQLKLSNPSLWDAEETCHAFPSRNQISMRTSGPAPSKSSSLTSSILGSIPESDADVNQHCFTERINEIPVLGNDHIAKQDVSMLESNGEPEPGASCSRFFSGTDSLGLSGLLANSLDAFPNFSVS